MAQKQITVVINGQEFVSKAAKEAEDGVGGLIGKLKGWNVGLADFKAGWDMITGAVRAVWDVLSGAIEEAQTSRVAMGQLELAVTNSGASWKKMAPEIEGTITKLARFSKFGDDELASTLQSMVLKTGDAAWAQKNLGQAADLAAAANIDLEKAGAALAQAHEGHTKALFKLIPELKGASNWQEMLASKTEGAAEAQMRQLGPVAAIQKQLGEFAESIGKAILGSSGFEETGFKVADMLANMASWIDENARKAGPFVEAMIEIGKSVLEALTPVWTILKTVAMPILKLVVGTLVEMGYALRAGTIFWEEVAGKILQVVGTIYEKGGKLLKAFGITVVEGVGKSMRELGERMDTEASDRWDKLVVDQKAFIAKVRSGGEQMVNDVGQQEKQKQGIVKQSLDEQEKATKAAKKEEEKAWKEYLKAVKETHDEFDKMSLSTHEIAKKLGPAVEKALSTAPVDAFNRTQREVKELADKAFKAITDGEKPSVSTFENLRARIRLSGVSLEQMARTTLDAASAFGVLDDSTRRALESAISLAVAVTKLSSSKGGAQDIASAITSAASLMSQMIGNDGGRKKLIAENTEAINRNSKKLDSLSLDVSGETFAKVQSALGSVVDVIKGGRGAKNTTDVLAALQAQGVGMGDLKKVAEQLGIRIFSDSGALSVDGLKQLFEMMGLVNMGSFGTDYASRREAMLKGFELRGASGATQLASLAGLGGSFSQLLDGIYDPNNLGATRTKLLGLFDQMNAGGFAPSQLGGLTSREFLDFITDLIQRIDALAGANTGSPTGTISAGGLTISAPALNSVQDSVTISVGDLLVSANTFAERTANASEESARRLTSIDAKMTSLLDLTAASGASVSRMDASLESIRRLGNLERGIVAPAA